MADQFFWIAFAPYGGSKWDKMTTVEEVETAVFHKSVRDVNFVPAEDPKEVYSSEIAKIVSDRLWIIILSAKQVKHLTITKEHQALIDAHITNSAEEVI